MSIDWVCPNCGGGKIVQRIKSAEIVIPVKGLLVDNSVVSVDIQQGFVLDHGDVSYECSGCPHVLCVGTHQDFLRHMIGYVKDKYLVESE